MLITTIIISVVFIAIAIIINEKNAKYLLAGYNTMSEEERGRFDINGFLKSLKSILVFVGVTLLLLYSLLSYYSLEDYTFIILVIIPILLVPSILYISQKYNNSIVINDEKPKRLFFWILGSLTVVLPVLLVIIVLYSGMKETNFEIETNSFIIDGSYGKVIIYEDIIEIRLVEELPEITTKTNGFALGKILKGDFLSEEGKVYLNVNLNYSPFLQIVTNNKTLYLNNSTSNINSIYVAILEKLK
jgi:hypothetical protein